jgi:hypothetical protein
VTYGIVVVDWMTPAGVPDAEYLRVFKHYAGVVSGVLISIFEYWDLCMIVGMKNGATIGRPRLTTDQ